MKQTFALTALILGILMVGCSTKSSENKKEEKPLYEQVMDIHDEIMPSMGELNRLKRELKDKLANSTDLVEEKRKEMEATVAQIDSASRSMMVWMREFKPEDFKGDELQKYLEAEMKSIQQVKENMLKALEEGRKANQ
jgi:predicted RNase H-like nuclease (RuvC/YqgF family)